ncbi:Pre-mRNA-splicing factor 38A [Thelohanellus kitauei]|uniref:Pre-mRNA-splicing factor 38 n=1 Tax=Thelohanellus kitauei TaxID=669202 RepID=A0A0C2IZB7_THEKT|nr:Pre-mRNA-splicing factor 38A [Thelohanellus kitauei]
MANRTAPEAINVRGTNPQFLLDKIVRSRIYEARFWLEECFALTAELLVDKIVDLKYIGGCYGGNSKASNFLCLLLKMLQIQPEKEIIIEFLRNEEYKYMRALAAIYVRLVFPAVDCYNYLEPLYLDYRKLRFMKSDGKFKVITMDEYIDSLLRDERVCDIIMPTLPLRRVLEELDMLEPRKSILDELVSESDQEQDDNEGDDKKEEAPTEPTETGDDDKHVT